MRLMKKLALLILCTLVFGCSGNDIPKPKVGANTDPMVRSVINDRYARAMQNPGKAFNWLELGNVLLSHGYNEDALNAYTECCRLAPRQWLGFGLKAMALYKLNRVPEAREAMGKARSLEMKAPHLHWIPGLWSLREGDIEGVRNHAMAALQIQPENVPARRLMAQASLQSGENNKALQIIAKLVKEQPQDRSIRTELAMALRANGNVEQAARQQEISGGFDPEWASPFDVVMTKNRFDLRAWMRRILADANSENPTRARKQLESIRVHFATDPLYRYTEAVVMHAEGKTPDAMMILDELIAEDPDWVDARFSRAAMMMEEMGDGADSEAMASVEQDLLKVLELDPENVKANAKLAVLLEVAGRPD